VVWAIDTMTFSEQYYYFSKVVTIGTLIFFAVLDNSLIVFIKFRKPLLENKYFEFHRRHGFIKITLLKLLAILYIVYSTFEPAGNSGALAAPILAYGVFVITLLIDFIRK
jgi:fatty acid desaturase